MTDISVFTQQVQPENLSWDLTPPHGGIDMQGTINVSLFNQAQHYANGYIPSGTVLSVITATGLIAPYLNSGTGGQDVAVGILKASVQVVQINGVVKTKVGCAYRVHGAVSVAKLPFTVGTAALGGYIDATGKTDLPLIYFAA